VVKPILKLKKRCWIRRWRGNAFPTAWKTSKT